MARKSTGIAAGLACGLLATACMSGTTALARRLRDPTGSGPTRIPHYQRLGERTATIVLGDDVEIRDETIVRLGELMHFGFGSVMGVAFVRLTDRLPLASHLKGTVHGLLLWLAAFGGYVPALKVAKPFWQWEPGEYVRTLRAHLIYGNAVMLLTRGWQSIRSVR